MACKTSLPCALALCGVLAPLVANSPAVASSREHLLYSFCSHNYCTDGSQPDGGLIFDASGNLYGTTYAGGTFDDGTVFELVRSGGVWREKLLHVFGPNKGDGALPTSALIFDKAGNLYGTTSAGGLRNGGVFELTPGNGGWTEKILYSFGQIASDGAMPYGSLVLDDAGNLYGTTYLGGSHNCGSFTCGTVFRLSPGQGKWTETVLYDFAGSDGSNPESGLFLDTHGHLFGTTATGGANGYGTVFELSRSGGKWVETVLHSFDPTNEDGSTPLANLSADSAGNLYGTTWSGGVSPNGCFGYGCGTVFEMTHDHGKWSEKILHGFSQDAHGYSSAASLILDGAGNLYGTTHYGGSDVSGCSGFGCGTVFELVANNGTWKDITVLSFDGTNGAAPWAGLAWGAGGQLLGTTVLGGAINAGTVFKVSH